MTARERISPNDYVQRISILARDRNPRVLWAQSATGSDNLDNEENEKAREIFLRNRSFLRRLDSYHNAIRRGKEFVFKSQHEESIFLANRDRFFKSLLPIGIYLFYQKGDVRSKILRDHEHGDYNEIQESFSTMLVLFSETFTKFRWSQTREDDPNILTYKFTNKLAKVFQQISRTKIAVVEISESFPKYQNASSPNFQNATNQRIDLATEISRLDQRQTLIFQLLEKGFTNTEIKRMLGITSKQLKVEMTSIQQKLSEFKSETKATSNKSITLKELYNSRGDKLSSQQRMVMDEYLQLPIGIKNKDACKIIASRTGLKPQTVRQYLFQGTKKLYNKDKANGYKNLTHEDNNRIRRLFIDTKLNKNIEGKLTTEQTIILRTYYDNPNITHQEVAKKTGFSKTKVYRARKKLEKLILFYDRIQQRV